MQNNPSSLGRFLSPSKVALTTIDALIKIEQGKSEQRQMNIDQCVRIAMGAANQLPALQSHLIMDTPLTDLPNTFKQLGVSLDPQTQDTLDKAATALVVDTPQLMATPKHMLTAANHIAQKPELEGHKQLLAKVNELGQESKKGIQAKPKTQRPSLNNDGPSI